MIKKEKIRRKRKIKGRFVKVQAQLRAHLKLLIVGCIPGEKGFHNVAFFNQGGLAYDRKEKTPLKFKQLLL